MTSGPAAGPAGDAESGETGPVTGLRAKSTSFGLSDEEFDLVVERMGREPNALEAAVFGALWSEHCGYKNSRLLLKRLPTSGPQVLQGPGESENCSVDVHHDVNNCGNLGSRCRSGEMCVAGHCVGVYPRDAHAGDSNAGDSNAGDAHASDAGDVSD